MRRLAGLLLILVSLLGIGLAPPAAADEDGPVGQAADVTCQVATTGSMIGTLARAGAALATGRDGCDVVGDKVQEEVEEYWQAVWDSTIGDILKSGVDMVKWLLRTVLTLALRGPSLNLADTGLFDRDASLSGMLIWLGWVIAAFGAMWQIGKAAVTGQSKYWGQLLSGYAQNAVLSGVGLTIVAALLRLGDLLTIGLVKGTFGAPGAYDRILSVMIPAAVLNPVLVAGVCFTLMVVGFTQLVLIFLRQSAIPIQCLLLPIAGAGLMGGNATRGWAPKLITSILTVIAYKPIVAIIICVGFTEFGKAHSLVEWLRGLATLILAILAPGPLTKIFSGFGAEVGGAMSGGGALGAVGNLAGSYLGGKAGSGGGRGGGGGGGGGGDNPDAPDDPDPDGGGSDPVRHAQYVEQSMGPQGQGSADPAGSSVPAQGAGPDAASGLGTAAETGTTATGAATGTAAVATGGAALGIKVLDGINDGIQGAAGAMGDGGSK